MTEDAIRNLLSYNFHHTFIKSLINKLVTKLQKLQPARIKMWTYRIANSTCGNFLKQILH